MAGYGTGAYGAGIYGIGAAVTSAAITNVLVGPTGTPMAGARVIAQLVGGGFLADDSAEIVGQASTVTASDGRWTLDLTPTGLLADPGAHYLIREHRHEWRITVPAADGPHPLASVLVVPAPTADTYVGLTRADADARYAPAGHQHTLQQVGILPLAVGEPVPVGTPAGTLIIRR